MDDQFGTHTVSDYLHDLLREPIRPIVGSDDEYAALFNQLEYLLGVVHTHARGWGPIGRFAWRGHSDYNRQHDRIFNGHTDQLLGVGLFEGQTEKLDEARSTYNDLIQRAGLSW